MSETPLVQGKLMPVAPPTVSIITAYFSYIKCLFIIQTLSKGKTISTEALKKFVSRRKWQVCADYVWSDF